MPERFLRVPRHHVYHSTVGGWLVDTVRLNLLPSALRNADHSLDSLVVWCLTIFLWGLFTAAVLMIQGCAVPPKPSAPEARNSLRFFERGVREVERECSIAPLRTKTRRVCEREVIAARDGVIQARKNPTYENLACAAASVRLGLGAARDAMEIDGLVVPVSARTAIAAAWPLAEYSRCYPESPTSSRSFTEDPNIPRIDPKPPEW